MSIVYLNGEYLPIEQAKVSVLDRGFLFSDSIYEVIPVFGGHCFGMKPHLERLKRSLDSIHLSLSISTSEWENILRELVQKNHFNQKDASIYIQVTRGAQPLRSHAIPQQFQPTIFAMCSPHQPKSIDEMKKGFKAITLEDRRRKDCYIKATALLPNILAHHQAELQGAIEAILIRDGHAIEATSSNLFIVKNGVLITPPLSQQILAGITRELILRLAKAHHIAFEERPILENELFEADEIWVTGSTKEICPIVILNNKPVGNGKIGSVWLKMVEWYQEEKEKLREGQRK